MAPKTKTVSVKTITPKRETRFIQSTSIPLSSPEPKHAVLVRPHERLEESVKKVHRQLGSMVGEWIHGDNAFVVTVQAWLKNHTERVQKNQKRVENARKVTKR